MLMKPQLHPFDRHRSAALRYLHAQNLESRSLTLRPRPVAIGRGRPLAVRLPCFISLKPQCLQHDNSHDCIAPRGNLPAGS